MVSAAPPAPFAAPRRRGRLVAAIVAGLLVVLAGGGAFGADALGRNAVCGSLGDLAESQDKARLAGTPPDFGMFKTVQETLETTSVLLVFHGEIKQSARVLATDISEMVRLEAAFRAKKPSKAEMAAAGRVVLAADTHARDVQTGCGLPVEGLFGTTDVPPGGK
jgi:hypothetical protein